jgi:excinuclease UvrABC helicase subunit UvrB
MSASERNLLIEQMQKEMKAAANMLDFERAAYLRDAIAKIKNPE